MGSFVVSRRTVGFGPHYEVVGDDGSQAIVRGRILAVTPRLTMTAGPDGPELASLTGGFLKTRFECTVNGRILATIARRTGREGLRVTVADPMPWQAAVMVAVAVDQTILSDAEISAKLDI